eukprot:4254691-Pleurochrysis_carterae.AAC.3
MHAVRNGHSRNDLYGYGTECAVGGLEEKRRSLSVKRIVAHGHERNGHLLPNSGLCQRKGSAWAGLYTIALARKRHHLQMPSSNRRTSTRICASEQGMLQESA